MKSKWIIIAAFTLGIALGAFAAKKGLASSAYSGKEKKEAGMALLEIAKTQAGSGSWERIAVGRMYYLAGMKSEGQQSRLRHRKKSENSDLLRIGRVYYEAGEWDKAKQRVRQGHPDRAEGCRRSWRKWAPTTISKATAPGPRSCSRRPSTSNRARSGTR